MDYYTNAEEQLESAKILAGSEKYRIAVTLLCLSCELFLKSFVERKDPANHLLNSHDIVNLGALIKNDVDFKKIGPQLAFMKFVGCCVYVVYIQYFLNQAFLNAVWQYQIEASHHQNLKPCYREAKAR